MDGFTWLLACNPANSMGHGIPVGISSLDKMNNNLRA